MKTQISYSEAVKYPYIRGFIKLCAILASQGELKELANISTIPDETIIPIPWRLDSSKIMPRKKRREEIKKVKPLLPDVDYKFMLAKREWIELIARHVKKQIK